MRIESVRQTHRDGRRRVHDPMGRRFRWRNRALTPKGILLHLWVRRVCIVPPQCCQCSGARHRNVVLLRRQLRLGFERSKRSDHQIFRPRRQRRLRSVGPRHQKQWMDGDYCRRGLSLGAYRRLVCGLLHRLATHSRHLKCRLLLVG